MATKQIHEIWKCEICGNIVEVLHVGGGELVCCGKPMVLQNEKAKADEGNEKHTPVIEKNDDGVLVKVGSVPHPMEDEHYIEWIEISTNKGNSRKFLKPPVDSEAKAVFPVKAENIKARAYCNVHGLWVSE